MYNNLTIYKQLYLKLNKNMGKIQNNENINFQIHLDEEIKTLTENYINWKNNIHNEIRCGKLMFDVPKHYKWIEESELFTYYMDIGRYLN